MKKTIFTLAVLLLVSGCHINRGIRGSGTIKTDKRQVSNFKAIETFGAFNIEVTCQKPQSLEIEGDDNLLSLIETDVNDGVLHVGIKDNYHSKKLITVRVSAPDLGSIRVAGAGSAELSGIKNDRFEITSTGAAKIKTSGETKSLLIDNTGASLIEAQGLRAAKADVRLSGAGKVDVYASDQLDVTISGVGKVTYAGHPKVVNKNVSGIGSVSEAD